MSSTKPCDMNEQELLVKTSSKILACMENDKGFYMSFKEVQKLFSSQSACAYSGSLFKTTGDITFERINPKEAYTKKNVVLVRKHLNELKGKTIDRFIHQSGMSDDALADLFLMISKSLRPKPVSMRHPRDIKPVETKQVEAASVNEEQVEEVAQEFSGKGAFLQNLMQNARKNKADVNSKQPYSCHTAPRSKG